MIVDGLGWTSRSGCVRELLRTPQTKRDHNATRYGRDRAFSVGDDKHGGVEALVKIGGEASLEAAAYRGLRVTETALEALPEHVRADEHYAPLAACRYAPPARAPVRLRAPWDP